MITLDGSTTTKFNSYPVDERWKALAACRGESIDKFFPNSATGSRIMSEAYLICRTCPVRLACLNFALSHNIQFGVWGGESERKRKKLRRESIGKNKPRLDAVQVAM